VSPMNGSQKWATKNTQFVILFLWKYEIGMTVNLICWLAKWTKIRLVCVCRIRYSNKSNWLDHWDLFWIFNLSWRNVKKNLRSRGEVVGEQLTWRWSG
jgi:hypothetical protein